MKILLTRFSNAPRKRRLRDQASPVAPAKRSLALGTALFLLFTAFSSGASALRAEPLADERLAHIKAAFLLNIARFTRWSDGAFSSADAPLELCLLKENPLGDALETIRGKGVGKRKLTIKIVSSDDPSCHVLFVPLGQMGWFEGRGKALNRGNLLIIGDHTDSPVGEHAWGGETVALVRDESRIAFEVDLDSARSIGVELSSELLKLSRVVRGNR